MNLTLPYFSVSMPWIDVSSDNRSQNLADPQYSQLTNLGISLRQQGAVTVIRNDTWDSGRAIPKAVKTFLVRSLLLSNNSYLFKTSVSLVRPTKHQVIMYRSPFLDSFILPM